MTFQKFMITITFKAIDPMIGSHDIAQYLKTFIRQYLSTSEVEL